MLWPGSKSLNSATSKGVTSCRFQRKFTISVSSPSLFILVRKELLYLYVLLGCIHFGCTTVFNIYVFSSYSWLQIIISTPYSCLSPDIFLWYLWKSSISTSFNAIIFPWMFPYHSNNYLVMKSSYHFPICTMKYILHVIFSTINSIIGK